MVIEYQNVFWSDFCQKLLDFGQILGKIGQIVSQILESFGQTLIIYTLVSLLRG